MRLITNNSSAVRDTQRPFAGLGFAMDDIRAVAQLMIPTPPRRLEGDSGTSLPLPGEVMQPSGYGLLVSLGREIRGR